ncbi:MAG: AAA family ATPase, partial [Cyanobacteria bacterium NC_groundwater_1444_Ag_S-0.65um_54_12]|nr:AAA family ATPase [Cyanobacteria bacterium NC_groundwater_1444_Ag_S-0.65um_54_12]
MKIRRWYIDGFGIFHDTEVADLPDGLTVLVGPNEAGKSTLLDFLRWMLFASNKSRKVKPLHGGRLGGRLWLEGPSGIYQISRYEISAKKLQSDITRPDGEPGTAAELIDQLGRADQTLFETVYAFSQFELQSFANLNQEQVRIRLFSSSITGAGRTAAEVLETLKKERDSLLKTRSGRIYELVKAIKEVQRRIAQARARASSYPQLYAATLAAEAEVERLENEVMLAKAQRAELEHLQRQRLRQLSELQANCTDHVRELTSLECSIPVRQALLGFPRWTLELIMGTSAIAVSLAIWRWLVGDRLGAAIFGFSGILGLLSSGILFTMKRRQRRNARDLEIRMRKDSALVHAKIRDLAEDLADMKQRAQLQEQIRSLEAQIAARIGSGELTQALRNELTTGEIACWDLALAASELQVTALQNERNSKIEARYEVRLALKDLEATADVVTLETQQEALLEQMRQAIRSYQVLSLAQRLIEHTLARFEEDQQPAVLNNAAALFSQVTQGEYSKLQQRENTLYIIDRFGGQRGPEVLSTGTAQELYVCLRLSLIQNNIERGISLPVIMDDVFVNFDPERVRRMAAIMAAFAASQQILLFTSQPALANMLEAELPSLKRIELSRYAGAAGPA